MDVLNESEVSVKKLESIFKAAFIQCSIDRDGDLAIESGGLKVFIRVNPEKKIITFVSLWRLKQGIFNDMKKLSLINKLNDQYILVRFCIPKPDILYCDYQLLYAGGIVPAQIVSTYRIFSLVCEGMARDNDDLVV